MKKATFKPNTVEYLKWNDNVSDMKRFCGDSCVITYETCHIDDYILLRLDDCLKGENYIVPLHNYVIKLDDNMFTAIDSNMFDKYFNKID